MASFSRLFSKIEKKRASCSRTSRLQQKRGSRRFRHPKINAFPIHFSLIFRVFSGTPPGDHFWRVQAPILPQKCDFGAISGSREFPKTTLGATFSPKKSNFGWYFSLRSTSSGRPGRCMFRSWSQNGPKTHFYRFYGDFVTGFA